MSRFRNDATKATEANEGETSSRSKRAAGAFVALRPLRCFVLGSLVFISSVAFSGAAQAPFASGAQMPDPKQISGVPLPVPDIPVGTVTVRVIRGQLTNVLPGQLVELTGAGAPKTATTDAAGRATFNDLPPGARVKASVTVDGERVESQEFVVASAGGTRLMLVATDAATEAKAAADRKLAAGPAVSGAVVLGEQSRFVIEIGDDALNVFNIFQIVNTAKHPVDTGGPVVFQLQPEAVGIGMLEGSTPNAVAAGNKVTVTGPFPPGSTLVQFAYSIPLGSDEITVAQKLPAPMLQLAVVAQKVGPMQMTSPQVTGRREMSADGQTFIVGQGGAVRAGDTVSLTLTGLPHRPAWPKYAALTLAGLILTAGAWTAMRRTAPDEDARRRQLRGDREALFSELASLEAQRRKGTVDASTYASRRERIVTALEDLYAGLEHEVA